MPKTLQTASKGKQAYEARRAEKAGIGLDKWMAEKERRVQAERDAAQRERKQATPAKRGLLRRLLETARTSRSDTVEPEIVRCWVAPLPPSWSTPAAGIP